MKEEMMENFEKTDASKRKFLKTAATAAYIAPVIVSMPAHATFKGIGSQKHGDKMDGHKVSKGHKHKPGGDNKYNTHGEHKVARNYNDSKFDSRSTSKGSKLPAFDANKYKKSYK
jgi:hypothetical protein